MKRAVLSSTICLLLCVSIYAQQERAGLQYADTYFLGQPKAVSDSFSPRHRIRFNDRGFSSPTIKPKKIAKWRKKGMSEAAIERLLIFPEHPQGIGGLIDDSADKVLAQFKACGGELAQKVSQIDWRRFYVVIEPSVFIEPKTGQWAAGFYDTSTREIHVVGAYYQFKEAWLRHAKELIEWELQNGVAYLCGREPYPRVAGWPCTAKKR